MIFIALFIGGCILLVMRQLGMVNSLAGPFLIIALLIGASVFLLKDKLNCPFAKKCPFTFCPLNKK